MSKLQIKCVKCGNVFELEMHTAKDGEYEVSYLSCPACHDVQIINVFTEDLKRLVKQCARLKGKDRIKAKQIIRDGSEKIKAEYIAMLKERENNENHKR